MKGSVGVANQRRGRYIMFDIYELENTYLNVRATEFETELSFDSNEVDARLNTCYLETANCEEDSAYAYDMSYFADFGLEVATP